MSTSLTCEKKWTNRSKRNCCTLFAELDSSCAREQRELDSAKAAAHAVGALVRRDVRRSARRLLHRRGSPAFLAREQHPEANCGGRPGNRQGAALFRRQRPVELTRRLSPSHRLEAGAGAVARSSLTG